MLASCRAALSAKEEAALRSVEFVIHFPRHRPAGSPSSALFRDHTAWPGERVADGHRRRVGGGSSVVSRWVAQFPLRTWIRLIHILAAVGLVSMSLVFWFAGAWRNLGCLVITLVTGLLMLVTVRLGRGAEED
jgi:hypothetical protein